MKAIVIEAGIPDEVDEAAASRQLSREASSRTASGIVTVHRVYPQSTSRSRRRVRTRGDGSTPASSMRRNGAVSFSGMKMRSPERKLRS
jgi:hypothetical protein